MKAVCLTSMLGRLLVAQILLQEGSGMMRMMTSMWQQQIKDQKQKLPKLKPDVNHRQRQPPKRNSLGQLGLAFAQQHDSLSSF